MHYFVVGDNVRIDLEPHANTRLNLLAFFCLCLLSPSITLVHHHSQLFLFGGNRSQLVQVGLKVNK